LTGKEFPLEPIKIGEKKGEIELEIGEPGCPPKYIVKLKFSDRNKGGTLSVTTPNGDSISSPRAFLQRLCGDITFNPFDLIRLPKEKMLAKVKEIAGLDFTEIDAKYKEKYNERALTNKIAATHEASLRDSGLQETDFSKYKEKIDIVALYQEKNGIDSLKEEAEHLAQKMSRDFSDINKAKEILKDLYFTIAEVNVEIEALNKAHETASEQLQGINKRLVTAPTRLPVIEKKIAEADTHNKMHEKVIQAKDSRDRLKIEKKNQEILNEEIEAIKAEKASMIQKSNLPVEGLTFEDDGLYLDGLPFDENQINKARIIEVGYQLSKVLHKDMRIMRIDSSSLDDVTLGAFWEFAKQNDYQVFIEKVDSATQELQLQFIEEE
jgi:chromosome segregation ATPase